jgi:hypothetical protein
MTTDPGEWQGRSASSRRRERPASGHELDPVEGYRDQPELHALLLRHCGKVLWNWPSTCPAKLSNLINSARRLAAGRRYRKTRGPGERVQTNSASRWEQLSAGDAASNAWYAMGRAAHGPKDGRTLGPTAPDAHLDSRQACRITPATRDQEDPRVRNRERRQYPILRPPTDRQGGDAHGHPARPPGGPPLTGAPRFPRSVGRRPSHRAGARRQRQPRGPTATANNGSTGGALSARRRPRRRSTEPPLLGSRPPYPARHARRITHIVCTLHRDRVRRVGRQVLNLEPGVLVGQPGAHRDAVMGGQVIAHRRHRRVAAHKPPRAERLRRFGLNGSTGLRRSRATPSADGGAR